MSIPPNEKAEKQMRRLKNVKETFQTEALWVWTETSDALM